MMIKISVVIPCYFSEQTITDVVEETIREFDSLYQYDHELILVNDGSTDGTFDKISALAQKYSFVTGVDLAKNFGQHNAILAGMTFASGDYILGMDDDFQTHPSQIHKLISKLEEGFDIVYGKFPERQHSAMRNLQSRLSECTARYLLDNPKGLKACPMYIIRSFVKDEIIKNQSSYVNLRGLFLRTSSRITNVEIEHFERRSGKSGYTLRRLLRLWSAYLNYSAKPVRLVRIGGGVLAASGIVYLLLALLLKASTVHILSAELVLATGVIVGVLGILGEYLVRLFMVSTHEPQYVIRKILSYSRPEEMTHEKTYTDPRRR